MSDVNIVPEASFHKQRTISKNLFRLHLCIEKMVPRIGQSHEKCNYWHKKERNYDPLAIYGFGIKESHHQP